MYADQLGVEDKALCPVRQGVRELPAAVSSSVPNGEWPTHGIIPNGAKVSITRDCVGKKIHVREKDTCVQVVAECVYGPLRAS